MSVHTLWPRPTQRQLNYLQILFNDLGYTAEQKHAKLKADFFVDHLDELTISQASALINELKLAKENLQ